MNLISTTKNNSVKQNKKKGFTLIELMAVIAIVAILAAAFIPKISGFINESKKVAVINEASKVLSTYESLKTRSSSIINESDKISLLISKSNGVLLNSDISKIDTSTISIEDCKNILNSEIYTFQLDNSGKLSNPASIVTYASLE